VTFTVLTSLKVNDLLKQQLQKRESVVELSGTKSTPHLVQELSAEVERLKLKLQERDQEK